MRKYLEIDINYFCAKPENLCVEGNEEIPGFTIN